MLPSFAIFMKNKMSLIGLLLNLAAITAAVATTDNDSLVLLPSDSSVVRYTNESLIVQCHSVSGEDVHWKSPKGDIIKDHRGRLHIEQTAQDTVKIVFTHIALGDKGDWICEDTKGEKGSKSFNLIVYQKITFTENSTILTVKEGKNATILCEVKGEPQPNVTWSFNGQPISIDSDSTKFRILADGLLINQVTQNDTGEYTCRAYQVNSIASDMQERTVLMKIEHKPLWSDDNDSKVQYAYINGTATITCEAIAEPPANFTWHRKKQRLHNDKHYTVHTENYKSTLTVRVHDGSLVFDVFRCRAQNNQGMIERTITLQKGEKPPPPDVFELRGFNSNTFDMNVGALHAPTPAEPMQINGFRIEYMTDYEFKSAAGNWSLAKRKDFAYREGATLLISNLQANTTYFLRAATRNRAGFSDWTRVEKLTTGFNPSSAAGIVQLNAATLCIVAAAVVAFANMMGGHSVTAVVGVRSGSRFQAARSDTVF